MHIANKIKSVDFKWVQFPVSGLIYCPCGKDNAFRSGEPAVRCTNCNKVHVLSELIKDYDKALNALINLS